LVYLCTQAHGFFRASRVGDQILNCYRLAKFYSVNPAEFLAMPLDEVEEHMRWTDRLLEVGEARRPRQ
jgi:hypothetical protein